MSSETAEDLEITKAPERVLEAQKKEEFDGLFSAMAPYWINGLHNKEGIEYAKKLNQRIQESGLEGDRNGIAKLIETDEMAKRYMLGVVTRKHYLEDPHLQANLAEPPHLVGRMFARDKDGAYRPAAGGSPVLVDKKDSLRIKGKTQDSYKAAIELAEAKGWTAIKLKGKPAMMAGVWLEAQLKGIEVVGYEPSELDKKRLAERLAELGKDKPQPQPEYSMQYEYQGRAVVEKFDNVQDAATAFSRAPEGVKPAIMRSIGDEMKVVADTLDQGAGLQKIFGKDDLEFAAAFEVAEKARMKKEQARPEVQADPIKDGPITGRILDVRDGIVYQKKGADGVVKHSLDSLTRAPVVGVVETITFRRGRGIVEDKKQELGKGHAFAR